MPNPVDGHGSLSLIGRDDHFAQRVRFKSQILIFGWQVSVERQHRHALVQSRGANAADGRIDLRHARHEHENMARLTRVDDPFHGVSRLLRHGAFVLVVEEANFDRETLAFGDEHRAGTGRVGLQPGFVILCRTGGGGCGRDSSQIFRHRPGVEGGGHHGHFQIRASGSLKLFHQRQRHVAQQIAFMELVEQNNTDIGKRPVILQPAEQDAFGHVANARAEGGSVIKTNLVADFLAGPAPAFPRHTRGNRAGGDAAGLQHGDLFVLRQAGVEQHLRHLCRLAGAGRRDEHKPVARIQRFDGLRMDLPDGKRGIHRQAGESGQPRPPKGCSEPQMPQRQRRNGQRQHQAVGHEFFGLRQAQREENEQHGQKDVRGARWGNDADGTENQRRRKGGRSDERRFAAGLEEADQAAGHQQHDVNPEDSCWIHSFEIRCRD